MEQTLLSFICPRYQSFPAVGLYLEQVLWVLNDCLGPLVAHGEERAVTGTMVNNYVKQKLLPPPRKKLYTREHLARLTMLCLLKQTFSIPEIASAFLALCPGGVLTEQAYDAFCLMFEQTLQRTLRRQAPPACDADLLQAMVAAVVNKLYARMLLQNTGGSLDAVED